MLTQKQRKLLEFVHSRLQSSGVSPSFEEMKDALGLRSKSGVHRMIIALEERGFIRRLANRARALEVLELPDGQAKKKNNNALSSTSEATNPAGSIPFVGRIAAGTPIEALDQGPQPIVVPEDMLTRSGRYYALEVKGDSMINAGILNGDIVVIREQAAADTGDIVVALVEGHEATLKKLRKKNGAIVLEAANPAYESRSYAENQVKIQGCLVGLVRNY